MKAKIAVVRTSPTTVMDDIARAMELGGVNDTLDKSAETILKNNISWHLLYPGANTTPWQLDGAIRALRSAGFDDLVCVENETVVTSAAKGEMLNKQRPICEHHHVPIRYNFRPRDMSWQVYKPKAPMLTLDKVFPEGIRIPDFFHGRNIVHLPTVKCHIYTGTTGSMKNAFGGLLNNRRHYCHSTIHQTLVDLLAIQKEIHPGVFTLMDGTTAGNGPGPRTMIPRTCNVMLAGADSVAIDAVAARMMGFDPMKMEYIRLAHERGLGVGRCEDVEIVGDTDAAEERWNFQAGDNAASRIGKLFWFGPMRWLQRLMFHTPLVYVFILGSALYHDRIWYPLKGKPVVGKWLKETQWGRLFENYSPDEMTSAPASDRT